MTAQQPPGEKGANACMIGMRPVPRQDFLHLFSGVMKNGGAKMTNDAVYEVSTQWGSIRLDEQSYQDYLDGRSWLSSAFDVMGTAKTRAATVEACPRDISRQAISYRSEADKAGVWETVQHGFPGMAVQIPYRRRMSDIGIDELNLSVRASNGLMRAGIDTVGKLNEMMKTDRGIAGIRNLGTKSVKEIGRAFCAWCIQCCRHTKRHSIGSA